MKRENIIDKKRIESWVGQEEYRKWCCSGSPTEMRGDMVGLVG